MRLLSGPHWMRPVHKLTTVLDGAALFHFVCLDVNGKERNQLVVNTRGTRPHLLHFLSIHVALFIARLRSSCLCLIKRVCCCLCA